jgi:hypothetical protein
MGDARQPSPGYRLEENLVEHFATCLRTDVTPWGVSRVAFEFDYGGGSADVIALGGAQLVAFEAKLFRWRDALHQAYRTLAFAHRAYVIVPESTALIAARYEHEFCRRRVGLCSISEGNGIRVLLNSEAAAPLLPWVATRALAELDGTQQCPQTPSSNTSRRRSVAHAA